MDDQVTIKAPGWVAKEDLLDLLRQDLQMKLALYESQCRVFENKYQKTLTEFDEAIRASDQEDFQRWDDFMDWEAADSARQDIARRLQELAAWQR